MWQQLYLFGNYHAYWRGLNRVQDAEFDTLQEFFKWMSYSFMSKKQYYVFKFNKLIARSAMYNGVF